MFNTRLRRWIDPALEAVARMIAGTGVGANAVTFFGAAISIDAAFAIAQGQFLLGFS
jgi:hypothetical protein